MKCPECQTELKRIPVRIAGAKNKAISHQCPTCEYTEFEKQSTKKVIEELRENPLKIKQKVIKLSQDRLGIYLNKHIIESLGIKQGEEISVTVPDKKHILIQLG
jgi:hypothetical protein